jgi:uncharacterized protein
MKAASVGGVIRPEVDADSAWWWEALAAGRLLLPRCERCATCFFPPMATCPHCGSTALTRLEATGRGMVYSWVVVHIALDPAFAGDVPYTVVAADLEEGPRLFGRLRDDRPATAGAPVETVVDLVEGIPVLGFRLL